MRVSSSYIHTPKNTRVLDMDSACALGVVESFLISQIQYWIDIKVADKDNYKDSFRDGHCWVYNPYWKWREQLPCYSEMTIRRALKHLEDLKVVITANYNKIKYDKTKWYTINYERLESLIDEHRATVQNEQTVCSNRTDQSDQNEQTDTKDYQSTSTNNYVKCSMVRNSQSLRTNDFSYDVLRNQIRKICLSDFEGIDIPEVTKIIFYYCKTYEHYTGKHHPKMQNKHYHKIIEFIENCYIGVDSESYEALIDQHFETYYQGMDIDFNMNHFFTDGIITNRDYEIR